MRGRELKSEGFSTEFAEAAETTRRELADSENEMIGDVGLRPTSQNRERGQQSQAD
jgi:hypothetical protein